jgi:hypothetical protein
VGLFFCPKKLVSNKLKVFQGRKNIRREIFIG